MKKRVIVLGTHDPTLGRRLAEEAAKFRLSDVSKSFYCLGDSWTLHTTDRYMKSSLTTNFKIKYNTHLAYNIYTLL